MSGRGKENSVVLYEKLLDDVSVGHCGIKVKVTITLNRLLFKGGFIKHWILGSVQLVLRRFLPEAMSVNWIS